MVSNAHRYSLTYNVRHIHLYHSLPLAALPLIALTVASFGIGTTKFVLMGLLPEISGTLFLRRRAFSLSRVQARINILEI